MKKKKSIYESHFSGYMDQPGTKHAQIVRTCTLSGAITRWWRAAFLVKPFFSNLFYYYFFFFFFRPLCDRVSNILLYPRTCSHFVNTIDLLYYYTSTTFSTPADVDSILTHTYPFTGVHTDVCTFSCREIFPFGAFSPESAARAPGRRKHTPSRWYTHTPRPPAVRGRKLNDRVSRSPQCTYSFGTGATSFPRVVGFQARAVSTIRAFERPCIRFRRPHVMYNVARFRSVSIFLVIFRY